MAKKSRKLALKKETLRRLDENQLQAVAGGTLMYPVGDSELVMLKVIGTGTCGCNTDFCANYDFNYVIYW